MFCKVCGAKNAPGAVFCVNCGGSIAASTTAAQGAQAGQAAPQAGQTPYPQTQVFQRPPTVVETPGAQPYAAPQYAAPQQQQNWGAAAAPAPRPQTPVQTPSPQMTPPYSAPQMQAPPAQGGNPYGAPPGYYQTPPAMQFAPPLTITCISGPDTGKFYTLTASETVIGRVTGIGQVDPNVAMQHAAVCNANQRLRFRALSSAPVFINGQPYMNGELLPGQEFRLGSSVWKVSVPLGQHSGNLLQQMQEQLNRLAGTEKLEGFSLKDMFSEVFKKRSSEELEDYLNVGTYKTTPPIEKAQTGWPKPWLFMRVLSVVVIAYIAFSMILEQFQNLKAVPAVIMMGSLAVPLATVLLFFELNTPRNISFYKIFQLIATGGAISLLVAMVGYDTPIIGQLGPFSPGIIEEVSKLAAVVIVTWSTGSRYKYILNGMLFGAAVGVGFAFFESAGYAFEQLLKTHSVSGMSFVIYLRAVLAPFGHVAWTAIAAAALWRVKKDQKFSPAMFANPQFLLAFLIPVLLHSAWDTELPFGGLVLVLIKDLIIGVISWYVVFAFVQQGLRQVKADQVHATKVTLTSMQAVA